MENTSRTFLECSQSSQMTGVASSFALKYRFYTRKTINHAFLCLFNRAGSEEGRLLAQAILYSV